MADGVVGELGPDCVEVEQLWARCPVGGALGAVEEVSELFHSGQGSALVLLFPC